VNRKASFPGEFWLSTEPHAARREWLRSQLHRILQRLSRRLFRFAHLIGSCVRASILFATISYDVSPTCTDVKSSCPIIGQIRLASELQGTAGGNWRNNCYRSPGCGKFFSANTIARFLLTLLALSPELSHCGAIEDGLPEVPNHILDFRRRIATGIRVHIPSWTSPNAGLKNSLPEMPVNPSTS
jgi:hypothetical protein